MNSQTATRLFLCATFALLSFAEKAHAEWIDTGQVDNVQVYRDSATRLEWTVTIGKSNGNADARRIVEKIGFRLPTFQEMSIMARNGGISRLNIKTDYIADYYEVAEPGIVANANGGNISTRLNRNQYPEYRNKSNWVVGVRAIQGGNPGANNPPPAVQGILVRSNPKTVSIRSSVTATFQGNLPSLLVLDLPIPSSNIYQDIRNVQTSASNGNCNTRSYPETNWLYASAVFHAPRNQVSTSVSFDAVLYDISTDFSKINTIYPYDRNSSVYKTFTGNSGNIVDPKNPQIEAIASRLWSQSNGALDYARKAYHYVAENYRYINPNTGLKPVQTLLRDGGGDCGNFATIYISLLRNRGIPSKHLVGIRPDGSYHVWADFYLERYGWIPVDVTFKNGNRDGDFFGRVNVSDVPVILSIGVSLSVIGIDNNQPVQKKVALMQNGNFWNWYTTTPGTTNYNHRFEKQ